MIIPGFIKENKALKLPEYRKPRVNIFTGAFYVNSDGQSQIQVDRGFVNGLEPVTSDGLLIGGTADDQPKIAYTPTYDSLKRCYICIKVQVDANSGLMVAKKQADVTSSNLTIEAVNDFHSSDPTIHYHPIAIDVKNKGTVQLAYHDLLHVCIKQYGAFRHFMIAS